MQVKHLNNQLIDWPSTRASMKQLYKIPGWAANKGFNKATVRRVLDGNYPSLGSRYYAIIQAIHDDGCLKLAISEEQDV